MFRATVRLCGAMNNNPSIWRCFLGCLLLFLSNHHAFALGVTGVIDGRVRDRQTKDPLPVVNVLMLGLNQGTVTDGGGAFKLANVRAGVYAVRFSMVGYRTVTVTDVVVIPDLRTTLSVEM